MLRGREPRAHDALKRTFTRLLSNFYRLLTRSVAFSSVLDALPARPRAHHSHSSVAARVLHG